VPTHIRPSHIRFTCKTRPIFNGYSYTRLSVRNWPRPAKCPEPLCPQKALPLVLWCLAPHQRALPLLHRSYWPMRQTKSLSPSSVVPITMSLCRLSPVPAGRWPFPTLSLQSLHGCLDPYPAVFSWCTCSLLPKRQRPHLRRHRFGTPNTPDNATSIGYSLSRLQSFDNLQAPMFARPPGCTHR
jgi:hypothetical protein